MTDQPHILVVDDDVRLRQLLKRYLGQQDFRVTTASNADEARALIDTVSFDLLVLDVMMPGETGLALTRSLRATLNVPILLLTALGEVGHRIDGLESGADDYLTKPFEPRELVLRIRTILKRVAMPPPVSAAVSGLIRLGDVVWESDRQILRRGDEVIRLTTGETALLAIFADRPGVILSRDDLLAAGLAQGQERTIDVQVTRLRRKFEADPRFPRYLQTVRGKGYLLQPD